MSKTALRQDLRWITREGSCCCVMQGAGQESIAPFVLAAGHSALAAGQITTVPQFLGALLQNIAPWALQRVGSVRTWSVSMVALQALCLLALGAGSLVGQLPLWSIFALASLYWAAGWSVGPAWNTWMDSVVPSRLRAPFFSKRNAFCQFVQWSTMMIASAVLAFGRNSGFALTVFAGLFLIAGLARLAGAYCMARQSEPLPLPADYRVLGFRESFNKVACNPKARPLIYMLGAQFTLMLALPYLIPYLKLHKGMGYGAVMLCQATAIFSRIFVLPRLGKIAQRLGPQRLFRLSGVGLAIVPWLWLLPASNLAWCLALQVFTGACLAAYELGVTLVYLDAIPVADRTSILTRFSIFNTLAMFLGSSLGAGMLLVLPQGWSAYAILFAFSSVARIAALHLLKTGPVNEATASAPATVQTSSPKVRRIRQRNLVGHILGRTRAAYRLQRRSLNPSRRTPSKPRS